MTVKKSSRKKDFLTSKKLWAPVLLLILFVLLYVSTAPYGVFTTVPSKETANTMRTENVQLQQTTQMNLLAEKKIFTKENIRITDSDFEQQLKTFLASRYGINANDMKLEKSLGAAADKKFVHFAQTYKGVPVYSSRSTFFIRNNELAYMKLNYHKTDNLDAQPKITKEQALAAAKRDIENTATGGMFLVADIGYENDGRDFEHYTPSSKIQKKYYDIAGNSRERDFSKLTIDKINRIVPESSELIVYPYKNNYYLAYKITLPTIREIPMKPIYFLDAHTGRVINVVDSLVFYDVSGTVSLYEWEDPFTDGVHLAQPSAHNRISLNNQQTDTFLIGFYQLTGLTEPGMLTSYLEGPWVEVNNVQQPSAVHSAWIDGQTVHDWDWSADDISYLKEEENTFYHVNRIHDYAEYAGAAEMNYLMFANVNIPSHCNAYYDGTSVNFFEAGEGCESTGVISDVIIHEYGHGIIHTLDPSLLDIGGYWGESGNIHEGLADYWACTINNNPNMSEGFFVGDPTPLRICNSDDRYPEDYDPEPHTGAQIISGAVWDIREITGEEVIDPLLVNALRLQPITFSELVESLLIADDDNNNISDGTPNIVLICTSFFDMHGIWSDLCLHYTENPYAKISSPPRYLLVRNGTVIYINGTVIGGNNISFERYYIEWGEGEYPSSWSSDGITLFNDGNEEVLNGFLGTFDTHYVGTTGYITIKLTGIFGNGSYLLDDSVVIYIDSQLKDGWPVKAAQEVSLSNVIAGDVDNDGDKEILFASVLETDSLWKVHMLQHNGTTASGWPVQVDLGDYCRVGGIECELSVPSLADIDSDGDMEILFYGVNMPGDIRRVYAFHHTGDAVDGWPVDLEGIDDDMGGGLVSISFTVTDINNDGEIEILVPVLFGDLYVLDHTGNLLFRFETDRIDSGTAVGNLDDDDELEIVVSAYERDIARRLYALNIDGSVVDGWPVVYVEQNDTYPPSGAWLHAMPVIGDIDNDSSNEIIISYPGKLIVFNSDGSIENGWPFYLENPYGYVRYSQPALANLDGGNDIEILHGSWYWLIYAFKNNGSVLQGWPVYVPWPAATELSPSIGDLNNDGIMDVVTGSQSLHQNYPSSVVSIWDRYGNALPGWPRPISSIVNSWHVYSFSPVITDLENDGIVDLVVVSSDGIVYVWEFGNYQDNFTEWPMSHHDTQHTGLYPSHWINATFYIKEPSGAYATRMLRVGAGNEQYFYGEVTGPLSLVLPLEGYTQVSFRNQTQQGWDIFTVSWNHVWFERDMNATTDYIVNMSGPYFVTYALEPTWQRSNASVFTRYNISNFNITNLNQVTLYGCSTWNYSQRRCTSGWVELSNVIKQWDGLSSLDKRVFNAYAIGRKTTGGKSLPYEQGQTGI